jgi:hypothetical protein
VGIAGSDGDAVTRIDRVNSPSTASRGIVLAHGSPRTEERGARRYGSG